MIGRRAYHFWNLVGTNEFRRKFSRFESFSYAGHRSNLQEDMVSSLKL